MRVGWSVPMPGPLRASGGLPSGHLLSRFTRALIPGPEALLLALTPPLSGYVSARSGVKGDWSLFFIGLAICIATTTGLTVVVHLLYPTHPGWLWWVVSYGAVGFVLGLLPRDDDSGGFDEA